MGEVELACLTPCPGDDDSGRSDATDDLGDSDVDTLWFLWLLAPDGLLRSAACPWLFIKSVSILLQALVNMARGSHFSSNSFAKG